VSDSLLDDLDAGQRAAVTSNTAPLAIMAPAGSGKTRVLTRRIAYRVREGDAVARHVLALTFTRKAAGECIARLRHLGVDASCTAGTFHGVALAQLRRFAAERNRAAPQVLGSKGRLLGPLVGGRGAAGALAVNEVAAEIEWAQARLVPPEDYEAEVGRAGRRVSRPPAQVAELYARYDHEKRKRRVLDFDDVLRRCADAIAADPTFADQQRWQFRHCFVDEFQDATPLQVMLLRAWLGGRADLTVVGDPAQAIYGFAGADASPLVGFEELFGGETVALAQNYRSTSAIVSVAETALMSVALGSRAAPRAVRSGAGVRPTFVAYDDDELEAATVAERCWLAFTEGVPWREMGVLFRTNAQSARFETAFARRNVPFDVGDGARFANRTEVRALLERLTEIERESPGHGFADHLADLAQERDGGALDADRDVLIDRGREFLATDGGAGGVRAFAAWLDAVTRGERSANAVTLTTFHRAKGLEWSLVFVTGIERGLVPIASASSATERDEERRLLHVALSRARDELQCSWARTRTFGGRRSNREPSPWLGDLEHVAAQFTGAPVDLAARVDGMRTALVASEPPPAKPRPRPSNRLSR
jgi:DNA helicase-2/ATP-dependent DNA helicase PcrA